MFSWVRLLLLRKEIKVSLWPVGFGSGIPLRFCGSCIFGGVTIVILFIYFAILCIIYYLLLSPLFLLSSYNSWNWKWNHWCCHFWLQRTKSKNWWDFFFVCYSRQSLFQCLHYFPALKERDTACHFRCHFVWFNCHRQIWRAERFPLWIKFIAYWHNEIPM